MLDKPRKILYSLAKSGSLWERRIAMVSTLAFIRAGEFEDTLKIAEILLNDKHDLIQKASGWMLREMGKRSFAGESELLGFLDRHAATMPRVMLRYAIERLDESTRQRYLSMKKRI